MTPVGNILPVALAEAQSQFEAVLALTIHDIKNSLVMLLETLDTRGAETTGDSAANAGFKYEIRRINNNLVRLLSLYRVGASQYEPQIEDHPVGELIEEVALEYQALLGARGIGIETLCDEALFAPLDKAMIFSVVENAVNNASRYCRGRIAIDAETRGGYLEISVLDDGAGYPPAMLEQSVAIQSNAPIDSSSGTTGLGIYFSWVAARLHTRDDRQGYIALENGGRLGGSRFRLGLPLHR